MSRKARIVTGLAVVPAFAAIVALPFLFLTVSDPAPARPADLSKDGPGAYVVSGDRTYQLCPYQVRCAEFPRGALRTTAHPALYIKFRQPGPLPAYGLYRYPGGEPVGVRKTLRPGGLLQIRLVSDLAPGRYFIRAARDGMEGGADYFYFAAAGEG